MRECFFLNLDDDSFRVARSECREFRQHPGIQLLRSYDVKMGTCDIANGLGRGVELELE